jgi:hypothetical protein
MYFKHKYCRLPYPLCHFCHYYPFNYYWFRRNPIEVIPIFSHRRVTGLSEAPPLSVYDVQVKHETINAEQIAKALLRGDSSPKYSDIFKATIYTDGESNLYFYQTAAIIFEGQRDRSEYKRTQTEAIETAREFVQKKGGELPPDAFISEVIPIYETLGSTSQRILAYTVIFKHQIDGILIDGKSGDSIKVIVDNSGVSYMFRMWRNIISKKMKTTNSLINEQEAIKAAIQHVQTVIQINTQPAFEGIKLVYWSAPFKEFQHSLPLAWKITLSGQEIFVNAETGTIL